MKSYCRDSGRRLRKHCGGLPLPTTGRGTSLRGTRLDLLFPIALDCDIAPEREPPSNQHAIPMNYPPVCLATA